jgi:putative ABC transport system substrate-binding protein
MIRLLLGLTLASLLASLSRFGLVTLSDAQPPLKARRTRCFVHVVLALAFILPWLSLVSAAEPSSVAHLGLVSPFSLSNDIKSVDAFRNRLRELGWVEGQNLVIEARWAEGRVERLPGLMKEIVDHHVDVLVIYSTPGTLAAMKATSTTPIVVTNIADPIRSGITTNLAHPDHNVTGLSLAWEEGMAGKLLELLQEAVPHLSTVTMIANLDDPQVSERVKEIEIVAPSRSVRTHLIDVRNPEQLDHAFVKARRKTQGVLVLSDFLTFEHRKKIAMLASKYRLPTMYPLREFVESGGLIAYGPDRIALTRRAADYVDKILRGAKPIDLPFERPNKYELIVNLKAARASGITIPDSVLMRADEVIR